MKQSRLFLCLAVSIFGLVAARSASHQAQGAAQTKEVAITIDDLPLNGPQFEAGRLRAMTDKILAAINKRTEDDSEMTKRVSEEYLKFAGRKFEFCEQVADDLFGHRIRHILLLHANELVADNLDGLAMMLKNKGYRFITLEQALNDPVYQAPDKYKDTSDWLLHWSFSKGKKFAPPMPPDFIQKPYLDNQKRVSLAPQITSSGQAQALGPDRWSDYASADYDILPNITYSIANNTEL